MRKQKLCSVAAVLAVSTILTGCMGNTVQKVNNTEEAVKEEVKTSDAGTEDAAETEPTASDAAQGQETEGTYVDITLWDDSTTSPANEMFQELADSFGEEHGIHVERVVMSMDDLRTTVKAAITSGEGPNIFTYETGSGYVGAMGRAGLAYDLTATAQQDGWYDLFKENALSSCVFDGKLYGVANQMEAVGVYYNKEIFEKYNLEEPATYEEFESIMATLKENGELPIMLDDLDQWPGYHYESIWVNAFAGYDKVDEALALTGKFNEEDFALGLDKMYEIVENGWTIESPNAMGHEDAKKMFLSGQVAMYPTGTWEVASFGGEEGLGENCGFFFLPAPEGKETTGVFGLGQALVINGKADPDQIFTAVKFLEYMFNDENVNKWFDIGCIPATNNTDIDSCEVTDLFRDAAQTITTSEKMGSNLDVLVPPKVNEVTANYMQELLAGKKTGMECMEEKQAILDEEVAAGNYEAIIK